MKEKILWGIAIVGLVFGVWAVMSIPRTAKLPSGQSFGAAGNLLAEQYIPYVLYNGGYNSAKDIKTTALLTSTGTFTVGASGTAVSQVIKGSCALTGMDVSQTATTTSPYDCAVTGVVAGDIVIAQFATSSVAVNQSFSGDNNTGWIIHSVVASTTSGYITVRVANWTGGSVAPSSVTRMGSSTQYIILR